MTVIQKLYIGWNSDWPIWIWTKGMIHDDMWWHMITLMAKSYDHMIWWYAIPKNDWNKFWHREISQIRDPCILRLQTRKGCGRRFLDGLLLSLTGHPYLPLAIGTNSFYYSSQSVSQSHSLHHFSLKISVTFESKPTCDFLALDFLQISLLDLQKHPFNWTSLKISPISLSLFFQCESRRQDSTLDWLRFSCSIRSASWMASS